MRAPVDVTITDDPEAVFAHEARKDWCAPAGVQMMLASLGKADTSEGFQREIASRVREWESCGRQPTTGSGARPRWPSPSRRTARPATRSGPTSRAATRSATRPIAITETRSPAILLAWRGAHTWVMTGYRADADPTIFPDAVMTGTYILDPWYPWISSIWGQSDPPGAFQDWPEMERNFLPWKRPEGKYPDRDGKFIILVPTVAISASR